MAEKTNKGKPEEERPIDYAPDAGTEPATSISEYSAGPAATATKPATYKQHTYHTPEPSVCPGSLSVKAVEANTGAALSGITVDVEGPDFHETGTTGATGQLDWSVPPGSYAITVSPKQGYEAPVLSPPSPVTVADAQITVSATFTPIVSEIEVCLFHDANGSGLPLNQPPVSGRVSFFGLDGKFLRCTTTTDCGCSKETFNQVDAVEIRLEDSYTSGCDLLRGNFSAGLYAQLSPSECLKFSIPLHKSNAELVLAASVVESGRSTPLGGTRFLIHKGTDTTVAPVACELYTSSAIRVAGLEVAMYTITAIAPDTERGRRLRPVTPANGCMHLQLKSGQTDLRSFFVFEPLGVSIAVRVVKDGLGSPLAGVAIDFLNHSDGSTAVVRTDADGLVTFPAEQALYTVRPSTFKFHAEGTDWMMDSKTQYQVDLRKFASTPQPITMIATQEEHGVRCVIQDRNGSPRAFTAVEILDSTGKKLRDAHTNQNGVLDERLPSAGQYTLVVLPQIHRVSFETHSVEDLGVIRVAGPTGEGGFGGSGPGGGFGRIAESFAELTSYPQLTDSGSAGTGGRQRRPSGVSSASTSQYGYTIEGAIREVLGWRPKNGDIRGFTEALTKSFDVKEVGGHTEYNWTPRAAALVVESELGAITGAQKSIYERGKVAFDQAAPKLDATYPLRQDADVENCDAVRYIVRSAFEDLVREFGQSGGPRVQLVNDKFNLLLGSSNLSVTEDLDPFCQLAIMRTRFGLNRNAVNTIAEEENLTNFLIVVDHLKSLRITWNNNIKFFDRSGTDPFLGTQLVLLSRALGNVAEGVDEVRYVLSTVLLDEAEQQTIRIEFPGQPAMFISELLDWVEHVATVEGPQLLTASGKDGAGALRNTLDLLRTLVTGAQNPPNNVPSAYRTTRVQRALQELALALDDAAKLSTIEGVS